VIVIINGPCTHHLHIVATGSQSLVKHLAFSATGCAPMPTCGASTRT
jgi:hypothetical protein